MDPQDNVTSPSVNAQNAISDRYEILGQVGSGGMGVVYKARDRETQDTVAVKVLHPEIAVHAELIERFKTELLLARKITHKNICRVYDLNRFGSVVAISMEYIEGESLRAMLDRPQGISIRQGLYIIHQVIAGLAEAHAEGVIHRDLKPENILIARDGTVKVMDFGIARSVDTGATLTGTIIGTPSYMSPEQASAKTVDARSDIYSLGLVMYEMFSGSRAFTGDTPLSVAMKQVQEVPAQPSELDPHVPAFLNRVIVKSIDKNPAKRFQSAAELETALSEKYAVPSPSPMSDDVNIPLPAVLTRWQRADWLLVLLGIAGVLMFFPLFQRTSFAARTPVTFDRSVLRRIAQEYAQRLGARFDSDTQIHVHALPSEYHYAAKRAGSPAALELTNNPVTYWFWRVESENGTVVDVDSRGAIQDFFRSFPPSTSTESPPIEQTKVLAEKALREFLDADLSALRLETSGGAIWRGNAATSFTWQDPKDYGGISRRYVVRFVGKDIAALEIDYDLPPGYRTSDVSWQILPILLLDLVLLVTGVLQRHLVNLHSRWRTVAIVFVSVQIGFFTWFVRPGISETPIALFFSVIFGLASALLMFFALIPVEVAVRRSSPAKLSSFIRLFDRRALSESCGLAILRGTIIGLGLLGFDRLLVWLGTTYLGMQLDSIALLVMPALLYLGNPWPFTQVILHALLQSFAAALAVPFLTSVLGRVVRRFWIALSLASALSAIALASPIFITMAAVQPFPAKVFLLFLDFLILGWAFSRFDLLTSIVAAFTCVFFFQNYSLLVMFRPTGTLEQWLTFGVWGLFVLAAAALAFKSSLIAMYQDKWRLS